MEDNENIERHIRRSLKGYTLEPRFSSFEEIRKKLEKKRKRRFFFLLFTGLLISSAATLWLIRTLDNNESVNVAYKTRAVDQTDVVQPETRFTSQKEKIANVKGEVIGQALNPKDRIVKDQEISRTQLFSSTSRSKVLLKKAIPFIQNKENGVTGINSEGVSSIPGKEPEAQKELSSQYRLEDSLYPDRLVLESLSLPDSFSMKQLALRTLNNVDLVANKKDSLKKEKQIQLFIGAAFIPQLTKYYFLENKAGIVSSPTVAGGYIRDKKELNKLIFNYGWGLRAGLWINTKWEILAGIGLQRFEQNELVRPQATSTISPPPSTGLLTPAPSSAAAYDLRDFKQKNNFRYMDYSLHVARLFRISGNTSFKIGTGFHLQHIRSHLNNDELAVVDSRGIYYSVNSHDPVINQWLGTFQLKVGIIRSLNKTIQLQLCPLFSATLNSMYSRGYPIKQKNFGCGLETSLLFRLW